MKNLKIKQTGLFIAAMAAFGLAMTSAPTLAHASKKGGEYNSPVKKCADSKSGKRLFEHQKAADCAKACSKNKSCAVYVVVTQGKKSTCWGVAAKGPKDLKPVKAPGTCTSYSKKSFPNSEWFPTGEW